MSLGETRHEPAAVAMTGVWKSYGRTPVLEDFSLSVAGGEKVTLIGPSGSGKTTVLRLIMALGKAQRGRILIHGDALPTDQSPRQTARQRRDTARVLRKVGMVFQSYNLFPHMTVMENVTEGLLAVLGLSRQEAIERATSYLAEVGLVSKAAGYPSELSGGQQQRVAIARAAAMEPDVLLLDEITSALDPELVGEVLDVVERLADRTAMSMVLVTHEMTFARNVSHRVVMMDAGRIVEAGPPAKIFTAPASPRTRDFLRSILREESSSMP
jgi:polar amino acid transport system ATP-binding protein